MRWLKHFRRLEGESAKGSLGLASGVLDEEKKEGKAEVPHGMIVRHPPVMKEYSLVQCMMLMLWAVGRSGDGRCGIEHNHE